MDDHSLGKIKVNRSIIMIIIVWYLCVDDVYLDDQTHQSNHC